MRSKHTVCVYTYKYTKYIATIERNRLINFNLTNKGISGRKVSIFASTQFRHHATVIIIFTGYNNELFSYPEIHYIFKTFNVKLLYKRAFT